MKTKLCKNYLISQTLGGGGKQLRKSECRLRVNQFLLISELKNTIVLMQTSVVYLISCTYLQIVGTNQSRRGNNVNLSATCHLTLSVLIVTLVAPYKNPLCTSSCCNFATSPEHELKSHSVIPTWSCIKLHVTQKINFRNF